MSRNSSAGKHHYEAPETKPGPDSVRFSHQSTRHACAVFDGDPAVIELPPNENGYRVYARALAKPVGGDTWSIVYGGDLFSAEDANGNDLIELGLIVGGSVAGTGETLTRTKGKSKAVDISSLFEWSGTVCEIDWTLESSTTVPLCWVDTNGNLIIDPEDTFFTQTDGSCAEGEPVDVPVICQDYTNEWIFNIADLVTSDWLLDSKGGKLLQLRFYPEQ